MGLLVGLFLPYFLGYLEKQGSFGDKATPCYESSKTALVFMTFTYCLGFFFVQIPSIALDYKGVSDVKKDVCLSDNAALKDEIVIITLVSILVLSTIYMSVFKACQSPKATSTWFYLKVFHMFMMGVLSAGTIVVYISNTLLYSVFVFPLTQFATYLG